MTGLHTVRKPRPGQPDRWYIYAWRGGPCIHQATGARPVIDHVILEAARTARQTRAGYGELNIDKVIDLYRASPEFGDLAKATQGSYRTWLDRISARFGKAPLVAFTDPRMRGDVIEWRNTWAKQPRSADLAAGMMATVLGYAVENGMIAVNVASGIKHLHSADRADLIWEARHWQAINEAKDFPPALLDALKMAHLTGLRLGDLVALDWSHVKDKAIVLVTAKRKGRAVIPILPELRAHLDNRPHRTGAVLRSSRGEGWTTDGIKTAWQRAKPEGFDRRVHDLRGTYVTGLIMKGLTDDQAAMVMGWTSKRVAAIRARYVDERRVVETITERLTA